LVSSGSHQGNSDLSAEVRLLRGETNPQGLDLAVRVRRPVAARFFAMFAKVGTTEAGSHAVAREERGEWSGRVHGPNGRRVWIRVADLRAAKNGEWAVTCGCHYRQCPAGHPTFPSRARHKQGGREREQSVPSMSCSQRVPLEIVDLPGIKINEAKPRRLSLMTQRVHSMCRRHTHASFGDRLQRWGGCNGLWRAKIGDLLDSGCVVASSSVR
jgi:hypothetical protein